MNRRQWSRLSVLMASVVMLVLSACGGATSSSQSGPISLSEWGFANPTQENQLISAFEKTHPNIKITYKFQEHDPYLQSLKLAISSGSGPDLFTVEEGSVLRQYAEFLTDLTPYEVKADGANWQDRFVPTALQVEQLNGKTYGLPSQVNAAGYIWYNKTLFDQYGLKAPQTYADFVAVSQQLQSHGVTPFVQGAKDDWDNLDVFLSLANNIAPDKFYQAQDGKLSFTDPDLIKAMATWQQLFTNGVMQKGALGIATYPDAYQQWITGKAAMIMLGNWNNTVMSKAQLASAQKQYGFTQNFEFLPILFPSVTGTPTHLFGGSGGADGINKNSDSAHRQAAFEYAHWLTDPNGGEAIYVAAGLVPSVKGVAIGITDPVFPSQTAALQQESTDLTAMQGSRQIIYPDLQTALASALQKVASNQETPQQAMQEVQTASQGISR